MIAEISDWGKAYVETAQRVWPKLIIPVIIVLVGLSAFGLGRLSAMQEADRGLVIYPAPEMPSQDQ